MDALGKDIEINWYEIRDLLLGARFVNRNLNVALTRLKACLHPDARWLVGKLAEGTTDFNLTTQLGSWFLVHGDRGLCVCFAALSMRPWSQELLRRAADLGDGLAMSCLARSSKGDARFSLAMESAKKGDPDGMFQLGCCYKYGDGHVIDLEQAKQHFCLAGELGHVSSMVSFGCCFHSSNPRRWLWWGRAAKKGWSEYLVRFPRQMQKYKRGNVSFSVVMAIGRTILSSIDSERRTIIGSGRNFSGAIDAAIFASGLFASQIYACRQAVDTWILVAMCMRVGKDVRRLIGELIWADRDVTRY